jgi:hypothetical protein
MDINIECLRRPAARRLLLGSLALGGRHRRRLQLVFPEHRGRLAGKSDSKRVIGGCRHHQR